MFGPADFMASLNMRTLVVGEQPDGYDRGDAYHHLLMTILMAARAHGVQAIDGPYLQDPRRRGFHSVGCANGSARFRRQVGSAPHADRGGHEVFSPRQSDYDRAELILDAYAFHTSAAGGGRGAVMLGDEMIDEASRKMALVISAKGPRRGDDAHLGIHAARTRLTLA